MYYDGYDPESDSFDPTAKFLNALERQKLYNKMEEVLEEHGLSLKELRDMGALIETNFKQNGYVIRPYGGAWAIDNLETDESYENPGRHGGKTFEAQDPLEALTIAAEIIKNSMIKKGLKNSGRGKEGVAALKEYIEKLKMEKTLNDFNVLKSAFEGDEAGEGITLVEGVGDEDDESEQGDNSIMFPGDWSWKNTADALEKAKMWGWKDPDDTDPSGA